MSVQPAGYHALIAVYRTYGYLPTMHCNIHVLARIAEAKLRTLHIRTKRTHWPPKARLDDIAAFYREMHKSECMILVTTASEWSRYILRIRLYPQNTTNSWLQSKIKVTKPRKAKKSNVPYTQNLMHQTGKNNTWISHEVVKRQIWRKDTYGIWVYGARWQPWPLTYWTQSGKAINSRYAEPVNTV